MIEVLLSLRLLPAAARPTAAWLIAGEDPARWVQTLAAHSQLADLELYCVPRSRSDRTPVGLLVLWPKLESTPPLPREGLVIGYGRQQGVYLPVDAVLWPPATETEIAALSNCEITLFHPTIGLIGFSREDRVAFHQLLQAPVRRVTDWTRARAGLPPPAKLLAVMPLRPANPQQFLEESGGDIGEKRQESRPPQPGEPTIPPVVKAAAGAPVAGLAMLLKKLANALRPDSAKPASEPVPGARSPGNAGHSGVAAIGNFLAGMASKAAEALRNLTPAQFEKLAAALEEHRNREINRLLSLLQSDPKEGLRYALPLTGDETRGIAPPSKHLSQRNVDFNARGLGGGRPADPWNLSRDVQQKLRERYRVLASHELQIGRHRRAAYIFAHLLGDYASAANALKQGGYYREASAIYLERLHQKKLAAECLREGGLLLEAIPIYESLGEFETVAEIYTELGQLEAAAAAYRRAVKDLQARNLYLEPAVILEQKLHEPREALALLDAGWPHSSQSWKCLHESFRLLERLGDRNEIHARLRKFREVDQPARQVTTVANLLIEIASGSGDAIARHLATDATKVIVGKHLLTANALEARTLTDFLPRLAPGDLLLPRDTQRYVQQLQPPAAKLPLPHLVPGGSAPRRKSLSPQVVGSFVLPRVAWSAFASAGPHFYALGAGFVHQFDWRGRGSSVRLEGFQSGRHQLVYCARPSQLWVIDAGRKALEAIMPFPDQGRDGPTAVQMSFAPLELLAAACDENHLGWVLHAEDPKVSGCALSVHDPATGNLQATHVVTLPADSLALQLPVPMAVRYNHVYLGIGSAVLTMAYGRKWQPTVLGHHITHMIASHPLSRARVAVGMEIGGAVFTDGLDSAGVAEGLDSPLFGFTRGGTLIASAKSEIRMYRFEDKRPVYLGSCEGCGLDATETSGALLATDRMDEFAIVSPDRKVQVMRIEAR